MAMLMPPLPSATKLPTLAINAPGLALASVPLMEKAYVPLRLAFEKVPVGGGGVGKEEPLPPQAAANKASTTVSRMRCFTKIARAPVRFASVSLIALETPDRINRVISLPHAEKASRALSGAYAGQTCATWFCFTYLDGRCCPAVYLERLQAFQSVNTYGRHQQQTPPRD